MSAPLVSVNIPCYRQLDRLRRCIESVLAQSLQDFEVTLLDDGASDEYRDYAASLGDARIRYRRNEARLGAMRNMFAAITAGRAPYTIAFHEDDVLGTHYLEAACRLLDADPACGFVAAEMTPFDDEPPADALGQPIDPSAIERDVDGARRVFEAFKEAGIDYDDVVDTLEREGVEKFAKSFRQLFQHIEEKRDALVAA